MDTTRFPIDETPELPAAEYPEWASTLSSQITGTVLFDLSGLPPLLLEGGAYRLPLTLVKSFARCLIALKPSKASGANRGKHHSIFAPRRQELTGAIQGMRDALDPLSASAFGEALFAAWQIRKYDPRLSWCAWGWIMLGDDWTIFKLYELIERFSREGSEGYSKAMSLVGALKAVDTPMSTMTLAHLARTERFPRLQKETATFLDELAERSNLSTLELEDARVPDLGLDALGHTTIDYGPRQFTVTVGDELTPMLLDASGGRWMEPPRKRESDDAFKVQAAREQWALLSRSLSHVLLAQSERLEELMLQGWRWGREQFRRNVQHHPVMCHFARSLLWSAYDGDGRPSHPFRVAEDLTLANVHDDEIELPGNGPIGIVHRRELDPATVSKWSSIFADYQIRTPFEQLQRELYVPEEDELAREEIARLRHVAIEPKAFRTYVKHHGFKRGAPDYYRVRTTYYRDFPWIGQRAVWNISPGLEAGRYEDDCPQTIHSVTFHAIDRFDSHNEYSPSLTIEDVHPIVFSEALRHARRLIEGAQGRAS